METYKDHITLTPDMNEERLNTLRELFPDWFTQEGHLDINEVKKAVNLDSVEETERYEFRWFGKSAAKRNAFTPTRATLHYDAERSVNAGTTDNIIIEGENLEVLKILSSSYRGRIKCIYIDPPYNADALTAYNDNFAQDKKQYWEESGITENGVVVDTETVPEGRIHSVWMSDIYARLLQARSLLTSDGIIFISINDKEVTHLKKICDEVFFPSNFIAQFVWGTDGNFDNQAKIKTCHEYILLYAKKASEFDFPHIVDPNITDKSKLNNAQIRNTIVKNGPKNPVQKVILKAGFPCEFKSGVIPARQNQWPHFSEDIVVDNYKVVNDVEIESGWAARGQFDAFMNEENNWKPVKDTKGQDTTFVLLESGTIECVKDRGFKSHVISLLQNFGGTQSATSELSALGIYGFDYPKPTKLIEYLIRMNNCDDCIILDFFAGSGTTGHAVVNCNLQDVGGKRKFILVQFPEAISAKHAAAKHGYKKISDQTIARNKAVYDKIKASYEGKLITPEDQQQLDQLGFKVFTLSKSSFPRVDFAPDPDKNEEENLALFQEYVAQKEQQLTLAFNEDELITEILIKQGFMLTYKLEAQSQFTQNKVYKATDGVKTAFITVDSQLYDETVDYFMQHTDIKFICIERALDTTKKFNLKNNMQDKFFAF
ncbi:MAG: site-specific DNA-methyltransferase [Prevotella ruminicola]|uniref:site-specific DNA-methyltransferase (adenine-specific) n=1 Tax=Xylanibacter ruminicola TaxID=839 RepID=A0A9D5P238_XYLRU|nr:site-specific DNA-methyltransferase [Xylanibacter ruminicola]